MAWLVVTGYMGAGKSTVGRALAERRGVPFEDSDALIVAQAELDIPRIFATKGELWFRRMEERVIRDVVGSEPAGVLAVGGGAVESAKTRDVLARLARVVWLKADPAVLWSRVSGGTDRPLATDEGRFVRRHDKRLPAYEEAAQLTLDATRPPEDLVDEIVTWWEAPGGVG